MKVKFSSKGRALLALLLLVPAPTIGVLLGMILFPDSTLGRALFGITKVWMFVFPVLWLTFVERKPLSRSPARRGGFVAGVISGIVISGAIVGLYAVAGDTVLDKAFFVRKLTAVGLGNWKLYLGGMIYWILINAVLEEYVWRWFCVDQCARVWKRGIAIAASALFFTFHHILAMSLYFPAVAVAVCSIGVFIGGLIWSAMYVRYESIWPGYISHAIVDVAVFGIGAVMLFS